MLKMLIIICLKRYLINKIGRPLQSIFANSLFGTIKFISIVIYIKYERVALRVG